MQNSTDAAQIRKKEALQSALLFTVFQLASAAMLLWLRGAYLAEGFWSTVLLILSLLDLGMILPVWKLFKIRSKEIEGGEEDAAAEY